MLVSLPDEGDGIWVEDVKRTVSSLNGSEEAVMR